MAALVKVKPFALDDVLAGEVPLLLVAAGIQDPGNLGTMLRSAEAFGATGAVLAEGTVSPWNSKAVRAAAGSVFRLALTKTGFASAVQAFHERGITLIGTSSHKGTPLQEADLNRPVALLIGSEGTLALVTEAELNLIPRPKARGLLVPHFTSLAAALDALAVCLEFQPSAVELLDKMLASYPESADLAAEIRACEHEGDRITHDVIQRMNQTFVTPIDREDILQLSKATLTPENWRQLAEFTELTELWLDETNATDDDSLYRSDGSSWCPSWCSPVPGYARLRPPIFSRMS